MSITIFAKAIRILAVAAGAAALSACVTTGGGTSTTAASTPNAVSTQTASAQPVNYPRSSAGMLAVEPLSYDTGNAPRSCANDLRGYGAYLQAPEASRMDLNKSVSDYVREAGGADAAINAANAQVIQLRQQLSTAIDNRNPFDENARKDADDTIAMLEDSILLNQALAEALECRRSNI